MLAVAVVGCTLWYAREPRAIERQTGAHIRTSLARRTLPDGAPARDRRTLTLLRAFYQQRDHRPAWTGRSGPTGQARDLLDLLRRADEDGLRPADYSTDEIALRLEQNDPGVLASGDPAALAELDLLCTIAAFRYGSDVLDGRISPRALDAVWHTTPRQGDLHAVLQDALARGEVAEALAGLAPPHEGYRRLKAARARHAEMVAAGGWPAVPPGPRLRRGDQGPRVAALAARLVASGELAGPRSNFDDALERAVTDFQARHGRKPDGVVGPPDLAALAVTAEARLRQIELNLERWRWLPRSFGDRYLLINIPEYMLHLYEGERSVLDMRVVVGTRFKPTPVFSDALTAVIVNPAWNVPESIVSEELLPALAEDPDHLARSGIRVFAGQGAAAPEIDAASIDGDPAAAKRYAFRQDPGDQNALGRIKFALPNEFDVYLHDTPAGHLFARTDRSFSHGCIRVEDPLTLAAHVLRGRPEADPAVLTELIAGGKTQRLQVPEPLPVHILYFTAFVDDAGVLQFRDDVYGIDRELGVRLAGR